MAKLQESKNRFFLTVPVQLVKQKSWKKGQELFLNLNERGNIEILDGVKKEELQNGTN